MNEQPKISAPMSRTQSESYIKLEVWVSEANFNKVYEALNDIGLQRGEKFTLRMIHKEWDSTSRVFRY
jgi:hypothetical protein